MANYLTAAIDLELRNLGFANALEFINKVKKSYVTFCNPLLAIDVYKMGHMSQYAPGTTEVVSYLMARRRYSS